MPILPAVAAWSVPIAFALVVFARGEPSRGATLASRWALLAAAVVAAGVAWLPGPRVELGVHLDAVTAVVFGLVALLGFVIVRFSVSYLHGDPARDRYFRGLAATLASVHTLVAADGLLLVAGAWVATSLALHGLLTHFDRPGARLAAREKFVVGRLAEVLLFVGVGLIVADLGTTSLAGIAAAIEARGGLTPNLRLAALAIAACVVLKTAQLPFHGWITRVMEAPTPVSALLHAGVVNVGGLVLIRLSPLMASAEVAQTLLVGVGSATAVVGGLVAVTRSSVKLALAWSTVAQMGFLLVQCGLGAYALALLHLVAHSAYKAHAFLSAGSAVDRWRAARLAPAKAPVGLAAMIAAAVAAIGIVAAIGAAFGVDPREEPALAALGWVLALAVAPLLATRTLAGALAAVGVTALSFAWHALFEGLLPHGTSDASWTRVAVVVGAFSGGFLVQAALRARPDGRLARALYPSLSAGLWLDQLVTRATSGWRPAPSET